MFEISELKAKKLADLQEIAKSIGLTKTSQLKKLDLVYQILDVQAANPAKESSSPKAEEKPRTEKPKRKRVVKNTQNKPADTPSPLADSKAKEAKETTKVAVKKEVISEKKEDKPEDKAEEKPEAKEEKPAKKAAAAPGPAGNTLVIRTT